MDWTLASFIQDTVVPKFNYWVYIILMMIGLHAMISKNNLIKKLIGMSIFQTAIILFYVSIGVKSGSNIPILSEETQHEFHEVQHHNEENPDHLIDYPKIDAAKYANPLPHVLMLTAIVVGVSTLGLALAISQKIFAEFGTIEEDEILAQIKTRSDSDDAND
ncbi:MAG: multicomponent Na+:H+ antiporter subunit C [Verrucomicrobiales bacterium]|jgi:multicomponent Na+:H+ antiporter subunit C